MLVTCLKNLRITVCYLLLALFIAACSSEEEQGNIFKQAEQTTKAQQKAISQGQSSGALSTAKKTSHVSAKNVSAMPQAEIVYIGYNNEFHHIMYSAYIKDEWTEPRSIYRSQNLLSAPVLASSSTGEKQLIWTEMRKSNAFLYSMSAHQTAKYASSLNWSKAKLFSDYGVSNMAASAVYDKNDGLWVFWAARESSGKDSDIVYRKRGEQGWSKLKQANQSNNVDDLLPYASIDKQGNVQVEWSTIDTDSLMSMVLSNEFEVKSGEGNKNISNVRALNDIDVTEIRKPLFLPQGQRLFLHMPVNSKIQSVLIN